MYRFNPIIYTVSNCIHYMHCRNCSKCLRATLVHN